MVRWGDDHHDGLRFTIWTGLWVAVTVSLSFGWLNMESQLREEREANAMLLLGWEQCVVEVLSLAENIDLRLQEWGR